MDEDEPTHVALRFYSDERKNIFVQPTTDVENFDKEKCTNEPYYVNRYNANGLCHKSPAEVLAAGTEECLKNSNERYHLKKKRRSDALSLLVLKEKKKNQSNNAHQSKNKTKKKLKELAKKKSNEKQLSKFLSTKKSLIVDSDDTNSEEEINCEQSSNINIEHNQSRSSTSGEITPKRRRSVSPLRLYEPVQSLQQRIEPPLGLENDNPEKLDQFPQRRIVSPLRLRNENRDEPPPFPQGLVALHQVQNEETNNDGSIPDNNSLVQTPRRPRHRFTFYRYKQYAAPINDDDDDDSDGSVFDNSLRPETRDVADDGELYAIDGDYIYIGCGKQIQVAFWEYIKHRGPTVFLREMAVIYWGESNLVNRCFKQSKTSTELVDRSPRKVFTPTKYKKLKRLFKDYLQETLGNSSKKKKILRKMNTIIGYKIRDIRKTRCERVTEI